MQIVILCGGEGTRLRKYTEEIPKPLVEVGGRPILWHIMKLYSHYGFKDFILCLGYKGEKIKEYFLNYRALNQDFSLKMGEKSTPQFYSHTDEEWNITFADTGLKTPTGGRIKKIEKYIEGDTFMATYADGLADLNVHSLLAFHREHGKTASLTAVNPVSQFGQLEIGENNEISKFKEKPLLREWINGGFFVFNRDVFDYLNDDDVLEQKPFERLAEDRRIMAYKYSGFWKCMDTYKDNQVLNQMWSEEDAGWKVWE